MNRFCKAILALFISFWGILPSLTAFPADTSQERKYYSLETVNIPDDIVLEVGGLVVLEENRLAVCTRRGEVWLIDDPDSTEPTYTRFAHGLHEPLGLAFHDGAFWVNQRGELTKLEDTNGDDRADVYQAIVKWQLSGNYHEYSYGPLVQEDGSMLVTLNLGWKGKGVSESKWRGWLLQVSPEGEVTPIATGLRSPAGLGVNAEGDVFYAENQGDWVGSGRMTHLSKGDFAGNPAGLRWTQEPGSPLTLKVSDINDSFGTLYRAAEARPAVKPPSVWFPHGIMGISTAAILMDDTEGKFGPFAGQLFVSDQGHSKIMRVFQEQVNGVYQGVCFPFREGFASGTLRMDWSPEGDLYVGMTNRGWASTGREPFGIQKVSWTGEMPFEMKAVRAQADGFEIEFTRAVDPATAGKPSAYELTSFTYHYHHNYGSPVIDQQPCQVQRVEISEDGLKARLYVNGLRQGYIHEIKAEGVSSAQGEPLLHDFGYYTLNQLPGGDTAMGAGTMATSAPVPDFESEKRPGEMPPSWGSPDQSVVITTVPGLKYDTELVEVKAGSKVRLELKNPDDMQHNLVITRPGTADQVAQEALDLGLDGPGRHYIPESENVLFHTYMLEPESDDAIYFVAPSEPGLYQFVCTIPGHATTMRGILKVLP